MKPKVKSGREFARSELQAGKASDYIHSFHELKPGDRVLICTCVSCRDRQENHKDQQMNLKEAAKAVGATDVGDESFTGSRFDPEWIVDAAAKAKRQRADWMLFETTDRIVRNRLFRTTDKMRSKLQATDEQLRELAVFCLGLPLMTHLHPDATPQKVRSYQRSRGQEFKQRKGGRPRERKRTYMHYIDLPFAIKRKMQHLYAQGVPIRKIAAQLKLSKSSVQRWLSQFSSKLKRKNAS